MSKLANIEIYTRPGCGFCMRALKLLNRKNLAYHEYDIWDELERKKEMLKRANGKNTVPQIFINNQHIGGCDEIMALEMNGELDLLLV